jgi:hypothetical protein
VGWLDSRLHRGPEFVRGPNDGNFIRKMMIF